LAAWIGLVPKQHSTGGKDRLGGISKQGNRYLRWLLVAGAMAVCRANARIVADRMDRAARLSLVLACVALRARKFRAILDAPASGDAPIL
jgi:transposase